MGIKHLNRFLLSHCSNESIRNRVSLEEFRGKVLVIDTSIYIYKFLEEKALIENMYLFVSILRHHEIVPVFIFDGKSPPEKRDLLNERRNKKKEAEKTYLKLKASVVEEDADTEQRLELLRRQFIRITNENIRTTKELIRACGIPYYDAAGEADELCVRMVKENKAWACVSDDMDMFVYGCSRVIRNIHLSNQTCSLYTLDSILDDLSMSMTEFRQILVLSGTDYNINDTTNLNETMNWYNEYIKQMSRGKGPRDFYDWLCENTKYITNRELLQKTYAMFSLDDSSVEIPAEIGVGEKDDEALQEILEKEGFLL